jgi:phage gp46-like protein
MPDISTFWDVANARGDWALAGADLASGSDLATAVLVSLFTDRAADPDDAIPDGTTDPRGWWGDTGAASPIGSKLWLLARAKATEAVRLRARDYAEQALQWLLDDGVAAEVAVTAAWARPDLLALDVVIAEPDGRSATFNYQWAWKAVS